VQTDVALKNVLSKSEEGDVAGIEEHRRLEVEWYYDTYFQIQAQLKQRIEKLLEMYVRKFPELTYGQMKRLYFYGYPEF
jgi:hypothetical protein